MSWALIAALVWVASAIPVVAVLALATMFDDANRLPQWQRILLVAFAPITVVIAALMIFPPTRLMLWGLYAALRK